MGNLWTYSILGVESGSDRQSLLRISGNNKNKAFHLMKLVHCLRLGAGKCYFGLEKEIIKCA